MFVRRIPASSMLLAMAFFESADQPVLLAPNEEQKLRLQLAQRDRGLNLSRRCGMESEIGSYKAKRQFHELARRSESGAR